MNAVNVTLQMNVGDSVIVFDAEDQELIDRYSWWLSPRRTVTYAVGYEVGSGRKGTKVYLHRLVMRAKPTQQVDHINGNGLDCRKSNLRFCTVAQNRRNQAKTRGRYSVYKGVSFKDGHWRAYITFNSKTKDLGSRYVTEEEAARVYDRKAIELFGAFAQTNFPLSDYILHPIGPIPLHGAVIHKGTIGWNTRAEAEAFLESLAMELSK